MADPLSTQLITQARRLARLDSRRPKQGNLRRAISAAYYGLFHFLTDQTCRCIIGTSNNRRSYRNVLARAFEHGVMGQACRSFQGGTLPAKIRDRLPATFAVSAEVRDIALMFMDAQERRHEADYDLGATFTRSEVLAFVDDVERAMSQFSTVLADVESKFFLACLLTWGSLRK